MLRNFLSGSGELRFASLHFVHLNQTYPSNFCNIHYFEVQYRSTFTPYSEKLLLVKIITANITVYII